MAVVKKQTSKSEGSENSRSNKRASLRITVEINALLRVTSEGESRIYQSRTRNLSAGGACIVVDRGVDGLADRLRAPKVQILVAFELQRGESEVTTAALPVWIRSTTDWVERPQNDESRLAIGLSFVDMEKAETDRIASFLTELSKPSA
jgi:c-di-GMP-binding flagellar brake protein YcgR